ncbi:hypothetical protein JKF63_05276 [Porcisia hertigi]|uniref:LysM domain-containing protein n=1 Tax=Porcisia hertigi TaxID=2761500 RepID=A0A836LIS4_9TRYP|nr:hypothetical protein JKF63_05276 [Porcisia hertigi]
MEGLQRQFDMLCAALQPLGVGHSCYHQDKALILPDEVVSELQVALARATVVAHWTTSVQREEPPLHCLSGGSVEAPLQGGSLDHRQTLSTVALLFKVSVADIRQWNPQLPSTLRDEDVLPPNTYLKVRPAPSSLPAPRLTPTPASPTGLVASSITLSGAAASDFTSAKTPKVDAGRGDSVTVLRHHSTETTSPVNLANRPASASICCNRGLSSGGFPSGSDGVTSLARYSGRTGDSGRGTSHSPELSEPSMPSSCANVAPPGCSPVPVLMSIPVNPCYAPDGYNLIHSKERVMELSPSSEGGLRTSSKAHQGTTTPNSAQFLPAPFVTASPPLSGLTTLPKTTAAATFEATQSREGSPLGDISGGGGDLIASARESGMRGQTRFSSYSPTDVALPTFSLILKERSSVQGTMVPPAASTGVSQEKLQLCLTNSVGGHGDLREYTAGPVAAAPPVQRQGTRGGSRALTLSSEAREISVSLSATSPLSSFGAEGCGSRVHSRARPEGEEGEVESDGTVAKLSQPLSPLQRRQHLFALSPSLAAPSDTSSCSPIAKRFRLASVATPTKVEATSADVESPSCSETPIPPRNRRGHEHTAGASFSSTGHSRRNWRSKSRSLSSRSGCSATGAEAYRSSRSYTDDCMGDEDERSTPSTRPPAMLGCHVSSPPPNLSRCQPRNSAGSDAFCAPPRHTAELPPQLRHPPVDNRDAGHTALVAPLYKDSPRSPLQDRSCVDDTLDKAELAGGGDYDTLEGIAAAYSLPVTTIVSWNPYLGEYRSNEPLPPGLPIVLPMSDEDEWDGEDEMDSVAREMAPEQEQQRPYSRLVSNATKSYSLHGSLENSPAPHPPLGEVL